VQIPVHHDGVLLSYGALESKKSFEIPVESCVKELTLSQASSGRISRSLSARRDGRARCPVSWFAESTQKVLASSGSNHASQLRVEHRRIEREIYLFRLTLPCTLI